MFRVLRVAGPLRGNADTSCETDSTIDDQKFTVGAVVQTRKVVPSWLVKLADLDARRLHLGQNILIDLRASHPVEQHADRDACPGSFRQRAGEGATDVAGPIDVGFEGDAVLSAAYGVERRGKDPVTVVQCTVAGCRSDWALGERAIQPSNAPSPPSGSNRWLRWVRRVGPGQIRAGMLWAGSPG